MDTINDEFNEMLEAEAELFEAELIADGKTAERVVLGDELRYERHKHQLSQKDMEDLFAIKAPTICLYEQGKRKITSWHKVIIERFINGDYDYEIEEYILEKNPAKGKGVLV